MTPDILMALYLLIGSAFGALVSGPFWYGRGRREGAKWERRRQSEQHIAQDWYDED